eukprot:237396-Chlamydomonas_euryale.AAC.12
MALPAQAAASFPPTQHACVTAASALFLPPSPLLPAPGSSAQYEKKVCSGRCGQLRPSVFPSLGLTPHARAPLVCTAREDHQQ